MMTQNRSKKIKVKKNQSEKVLTQLRIQTLLVCKNRMDKLITNYKFVFEPQLLKNITVF